MSHGQLRFVIYYSRQSEPPVRRELLAASDISVAAFRARVAASLMDGTPSFAIVISFLPGYAPPRELLANYLPAAGLKGRYVTSVRLASWVASADAGAIAAARVRHTAVSLLLALACRRNRQNPRCCLAQLPRDLVRLIFGRWVLAGGGFQEALEKTAPVIYTERHIDPPPKPPAVTLALKELVFAGRRFFQRFGPPACIPPQERALLSNGKPRPDRPSNYY